MNTILYTATSSMHRAGAHKLHYLLITLSLLFSPVVIPAHAEVSIGISIGINVPTYPQLVLVPGYPVYYYPQANYNYFFYDGLYWVYVDDNWYASEWYNGPWQLTGPEYVPVFILRIPVRYYRQPPIYFRSWRGDEPPHWGEHWGRDWEDRRSGWDRWDRRSAPGAAPLPTYQRQYSGDRYPRDEEQQHSIRSEHYHYQPREAVTQEHFQQRGNRAAPQERGQGNMAAPPERNKGNMTAPPDRGQDSRAAPPDRGRGSMAAPQDRDQRAAPPERSRGHMTAPPDRGQDSMAAPPDRGRENMTAPQERGQGSMAAPPERSRGNMAGPQDRGQDSRAAPQDRRRGNTKSPQDKGHGNSDEDHVQDHR